jgi:hypothetical protein
MHLPPVKVSNAPPSREGRQRGGTSISNDTHGHVLDMMRGKGSVCVITGTPTSLEPFNQLDCMKVVQPDQLECPDLEDKGLSATIANLVQRAGQALRKTPTDRVAAFGPVGPA